MAKNVGRKFIISRDGTPIANVRTKSLTINRENVDATDDDSNGWREHIADVGQAEVNISVEGVFNGHDIMTEALDIDSGLVAHELEFPDGATLTGSFALGSFELEATYNEVSTFTFEIQSSGEITYTAAV